MVDRKEINNAMQAPVYEMWDVMIHSTSAIERPDEAHAFAGSKAMQIAADYRDGKPVTESSLEEMRYWLALENHIGNGLVHFGKLHPASMERRGDYFERVQENCTNNGIVVDIVSTVRAAEGISADETWEHFFSEFADYHAYLSGEKPLPVDEQTSEVLRLQDPSHYISMVEALWVSALYTDFGIEEMSARARDIGERSDRVEEQLVKTVDLLFEANKIGLAVKFGSLLVQREKATPFVERLVSKLQELRTVEGDDSYRRVYNFVTGTLRKQQVDQFLALLPKETTPLIFGSTHEVLRADTDDPILVERFEEGELMWATLSDGGRIPMPNIYYRHRTILGYGTTTETELYEAQTGVDFDVLPEDAKAAVEKAIEVADGDLAKSETLPYYKRLAFWRDEERGDLLYTVVFRNGDDRIMTRYPDHHGFVTSDEERKLDLPVRTAQPVMDTYMVMPYDGSYMWDQTFSDTDPNFFGPGKDQANAFWIMGNARTVYSKTDPRLSVPTSYGGSRARFVIVPVRYYRIEEDRQAPDPTNANEDAEFFASIK